MTQEFEGTEWQRARLPKSAVAIADKMPPEHEEVLGWVSDQTVAIHYFPLVIWRDHANQWWGGLPGKYLHLANLGWVVTHWLPFKSDGVGETSAEK